MSKLQELEERLKKYQARYGDLLKADKAASARYGNEELSMRMGVLESMMTEIKGEITELRKKSS